MHGSPIRHLLSRGAKLVLAGSLAVTGTVAAVAAPSMAGLGAAAAAVDGPPALLGTLAGPSQAAMYPSGLEVDRVHDRLVVADTGLDRVLFYSRTGDKLTGGFGSFGTGPGQFASPRDVAVDDDGNIYVADAENNRIQKFDADGVFQWQKGGIGGSLESLNTPIGVTWDSANDVLLVASTGQSLIKAWNAAGVFQWKSPTGTALGAIAMRDVSRGPDGRMWVTAYKQHQIRVYDVSPNGQTWDTTPVWVLGDGAPNSGGDNQLNFPYNVGWSPDGKTVYVSDTGNGRVARWDLRGATPRWLPQFGRRCDEHPQPCADPPVDAGQFNHLRRVAVDGAGNIYAADFWGAGIEEFAPDGTVVRSIEGAEPPTPGFAEAYAVDVAPSGQIYVMDRLNHRIQRFEADGTFVNRVGARGTQPATFSWPEGLTTGPDGSVWAVDTRGDRIERFGADLAPTGVPSFGSTGSAVGEMSFPSNADVAANGTVWVADTRNNRLQTFDPATHRFAAVGAQGAAPGQFSHPQGVAVTADAVYVADTDNNRVQKLTLDGGFVAQFSTGLLGPEGLEVAPDGTVWVADTQHSRLVHLSAALADLGDGFGAPGTGTHEFFNPHDLAFGNDKMYVADTYNNRVQVYDMAAPPPPPPAPLNPTYAAQLSKPGGHAPVYPAGVAVVDGTWYVADSGGSRIVTVNPVTDAITPVAAKGLNDPRDLELDAADPGALWVTDTGGNRVVRIARTGEQLGAPLTGLTQPYGLTNDATRVYVANTYGNSVRAFTRAGAVAWNQTECLGVAFSRPRDVGLADDGKILVADTDNDRIVTLDAATGRCLRAIGSRGSGPGQFKAPRSVTADGKNGIWVADALNYRLQHLQTNGTVYAATPVDATGSGPLEFRSPHCVSRIPGTFRVAVCDTFNFRMSVYDGRATTPGLVDNVGGTRPAAGGFNGAFAVAYGPDGSLYAADWFNHRIEQFAADGSFVREWGSYGPQEGSLIFPRGLLVTSAGDVVVTDSENNRIDVFTPNGTFIRQVKPATGNPLSRPHQTALDGSGGYWIADTNNSRVVHLSSTGAVITAFDVSGAVALGKPEGVAVDVDGTVLVSNTQNNRVERYSTSGALLGTVATAGSGAGQVRRPGGLLVTGTGAASRLWIADAANDRVVVLDAAGKVAATFGTTGSGAGQLRQPRGVAVDPSDGDIAVADFTNDRVSLWDPTGKQTAQDLAAPTVDVTSPAPAASVAGGSVTVTGTASDDVSVSSVDVAVKRADGSWLQDDGSWGATQQFLASSLAQAGAGRSDWSFSYVASVAGGYSVAVRATDQAGKSAEGAGSFTVEPLNTKAPQTSIRTPSAGATVRVKGRKGTKAVARTGRYRVTAYSRDAVGNQDATAATNKFFVHQVRPRVARREGLGRVVELKGVAVDDVAVGVVVVSVRNRDTRQWLQVDGTFGPERATVAADLESPQSRSTRWSYAFSTRN